jgi:hypothetical protein
MGVQTRSAAEVSGDLSLENLAADAVNERHADSTAY